MSISQIQKELKAPKGQTNNFGGYKYRSCEDIIEAVKPLLHDFGYHLNITDSVHEVGGRVYVKATASIWSSDGKCVSISEGWAREADSKKGMDDSQITGAASSYARKYALNGLLAIDDTKDNDTDELAMEQMTSGGKYNKEQKQDHLLKIQEYCADLKYDHLRAELDKIAKDPVMKRAVWGDLSDKQKEIVQSIKDGNI